MEEIKSDVKEKSMRQKLHDKEISFSEYRRYIITKMGFKSSKEYLDWSAQKKGYKNHREHLDCLAQQRGFKDHGDYNEFLAHNKGFNNFSDYKKHRTHINGLKKPQSENKECSNYLGIVIAERLLSKIFENVVRMPNGNPGFDFVCNKGYKIDVKSGCILNEYYWYFNIRKNKIADYFLLLAFDSRDELNPLHIWLIKGTDIVGTRNKGILNNKNGLCIVNSPRIIESYMNFEQKEKLDKLVACCKALK